MSDTVKKRKGGRPRKYPLPEGAVPNTPQEVSEAKEWEQEVELENVKLAENAKSAGDKVDGPIVVEVGAASAARAAGRIRDAVFQCPDGHNTRAMENETIQCRICEKPTRLWVVYEEPQRKQVDRI